jgi:hypothetical protein
MREGFHSRNERAGTQQTIRRRPVLKKKATPELNWRMEKPGEEIPVATGKPIENAA